MYVFWSLYIRQCCITHASIQNKHKYNIYCVITKYIILIIIDLTPLIHPHIPESGQKSLT